MSRDLREYGTKTVYYSPSGWLHRLNLSAIALNKSGIRLADQYHLVPISSTRQIVTGHQTINSVNLTDALIYGGIYYDIDSIAITQANAAIGVVVSDSTIGLIKNINQYGENNSRQFFLPGTEKEAKYLDNLLRSQGINTTLRTGY